MSAWTYNNILNQSGREVIVTGANTGIGFETARALARKGAHVTLVCRNLNKGREALEHILAESVDAVVSLEQLDLSDLRDIEAFAERFKDKHERLDLLILNAGVMVTPESKKVSSPTSFSPSSCNVVFEWPDPRWLSLRLTPVGPRRIYSVPPPL